MLFYSFFEKFCWEVRNVPRSTYMATWKFEIFETADIKCLKCGKQLTTQQDTSRISNIKKI